ncbi:helix-turn-helix domain-containing protein [Clostridium scatologenes]|uniref:HTH cro/C1-type domain-containing protein n=1 Tax=Clostridium scatologenes TaxID=1548 RepID=A0A0E3MAZ2_CLOSL|nr:helix-turn-helix transcriptional regulator [Clostridium scatologenes]AKA71225.1 hypothetical protein CSCA_4100 [Clostridium scatologenes]
MLSAEKMKHLRLLHGISQVELGKEMGISKNLISMVENRKQNYTQEWHDKYINAIYKVAAEKKKEILKSNDIQEIEEKAEETKKNLEKETKK